jgi:hypothetical protein
MFRSIMMLAFCSVTGAIPAAAQGKVQLDSVSIHLFLATSGTLSPDVETIAGFGARNFGLQGEGIAPDERFYAALIKVRLISKTEVFAKGTQAQVVVTDRRTRKVVKRERIADVYIGSHGWTFVPVFVANAACGPFDIVVTGGGRRIERALEVTCGE